MSSIDFIMRDVTHNTTRGTLSSDISQKLDVSTATDISLNIHQEEIENILTVGADLYILLVDGQTIVLSHYFDSEYFDTRNLFLSSDGAFILVNVGSNDGNFVETFEPLNVVGKWSPYDDLIFFNVERIEPLIAPAAAPLISGFGSLGATSAGIIGAASLLNMSSDRGHSGNTLVPTIDKPNAEYTFSSTRSDPIILTGTGTPGSIVHVRLDDLEKTVLINEDGIWTETIEKTEVSLDGEYRISVLIKDPSGNDFSLSGPSVLVDNVLMPLEAVSHQTVDDLINVMELKSGVTLRGTVEAGAEVKVTVLDITKDAVVDESGNWVVDFTATDLPVGEYSVSAIIEAVDKAGNTKSISESFQVDTSYEIPSVNTVTFSSGDVLRVSTVGVDDVFGVTGLGSDGSVMKLDVTISQEPFIGTEFTFNSPVSDGTHLVITSEDVALNQSSTLLVLKDNATNADFLDPSGTSNFNIDALNLEYASDVTLSLTEADIKALSSNSDSLFILGGADDTVVVHEAASSGVQTVDEHVYNIIAVGDDGTKLLVDSNINLLI